jgi:3-oxoacyl-[acyl-carrier protein] reductase
VIGYGASAIAAEALVGEIEAAAGGTAWAIAKADAADAAALTNAIDAAADRFGRLDILVNSAGVLHLGPVDSSRWKTSTARWRQCARRVRGLASAAKHMKDGGRIINIGSTNAQRMPFQGGAAYAMSKSALVGLVKGMARDLGPATSPSTTWPQARRYRHEPGRKRFRHRPARPDGQTPRQSRRSRRHGGLPGRPGSGFVTGADLLIDGGFAA